MSQYIPPRTPTYQAVGVDKTYVHEQVLASSEWIVDHKLNKFPACTIVDSAGNAVIGELVYVSSERLILRFSAPFSGSAYFN